MSYCCRHSIQAAIHVTKGSSVPAELLIPQDTSLCRSICLAMASRHHRAIHQRHRTVQIFPLLRCSTTSEHNTNCSPMHWASDVLHWSLAGLWQAARHFSGEHSTLRWSMRFFLSVRQQKLPSTTGYFLRALRPPFRQTLRLTRETTNPHRKKA